MVIHLNARYNLLHALCFRQVVDIPGSLQHVPVPYADKVFCQRSFIRRYHRLFRDRGRGCYCFRCLRRLRCCSSLSAAASRQNAQYAKDRDKSCDGSLLHPHAAGAMSSSDSPPCSLLSVIDALPAPSSSTSSYKIKLIIYAYAYIINIFCATFCFPSTYSVQEPGDRTMPTGLLHLLLSYPYGCRIRHPATVTITFRSFSF